MRGRISLSKGSLPLLFSSLLMILCLVGCAQDSNILDNGQSRQLEFSVTTHKWDYSDKSSDEKISSRATPISGAFSTSNSFNIIADLNKGGNWSTEVNNETASYSSTNNIWQTTATHYWPGVGSTVDFYAYYPTSVSGSITHNTGSAPVLSYTVPDNAADQIDILTSSKTGVAGDSYNQAPVDFKHIFAAVQFSVGSNGLGSGTISSISIGDVHNSGTYAFGSGWTLGTSMKTFTISQPKTISGISGEDIYSGTYTLMMIPQTINNSTVTITYSNGGTLTKTISGTWEAGQTYNYGLSFIREYNYIGSVQSFMAPVTGTYKLEVWGAQGGPIITSNIYGKGGYSYGNIKINQGTIIYICIGGQGNLVGGYNGGGTAGDRGGGGGGATHIAISTDRGELKNYSSYQQEILLVAGGGGGIDGDDISEGSEDRGSSGGGDIGGTGVSYQGVSGSFGYGGSQTSGGGPNMGFFGLGGNASQIGGDYSGAGGAGWYGGGGCSYNAGSGGGGSGHLGSSLISGTTGMQNGVRSGDGYARITFVSAN